MNVLKKIEITQTYDYVNKNDIEVYNSIINEIENFVLVQKLTDESLNYEWTMLSHLCNLNNYENYILTLRDIINDYENYTFNRDEYVTIQNLREWFIPKRRIYNLPVEFIKVAEVILDIQASFTIVGMTMQDIIEDVTNFLSYKYH